MNEVEMQPDPVDYGEWKSGVNTVGTLSAVLVQHFSSSVDLMQLRRSRQ